jgi:DNA polymerase III sliding clamp (beta) subunit (PCNA family)
MKAKFKSHYLPALACIAEKSNIRYYLNGIYITPTPLGGCLIMATNGHILSVIHDEQGYCDEPFIFTIPKNLLLEAKKPAARTRTFSKTPSARFVEIENEWAYIVDVVLQKETRTIGQAAPLIDGIYPDIMRVFPKIEDCKPVESISINLEYMAVFNKALGFLTKSYKGVKIMGTSVHDSFLVMPDVFDEKIFFVIMPMRIDAKTDWICDMKNKHTDLQEANKALKNLSNLFI